MRSAGVRRRRSRRCSAPDTAILFGQNGVPWWYFYRHGGTFDGRKLESVDPGGEIWDRLGPERALGCVIWQAAEIEAPGVIAHGYGERMPIGEPSGEISERAKTLSKLLDGGRPQEPGQTQSAPGDLAQVVGQSELQSGERADRRHAGRTWPAIRGHTPRHRAP